jgi:quercetin dioxygenase-like cupin family protein
VREQSEYRLKTPVLVRKKQFAAHFPDKKLTTRVLTGLCCTMKQENPTIEICPGITRRTIAHGETMYQMLATLAAGSRMPAHSHPQEQIVHILEGKMRLIVEGVPHELSEGDSFYIASNVSHGVETLSATRVLDTFSPPRDEYLAIDHKVLHGAL